MIKCAVCGFDNLPVTSANIYGLAQGPSLRMVSWCHNCGAEIARKCPVCQQLHPLGTSFCPGEGISVQKLIDEQVSLKAQVAAFKNSDEYRKTILFMRYVRWSMVAFYSLFIWGVGLLLSQTKPEQQDGDIAFFAPPPRVSSFDASVCRTSSTV